MISTHLSPGKLSDRRLQTNAHKSQSFSGIVHFFFFFWHPAILAFRHGPSSATHPWLAHVLFVPLFMAEDQAPLWSSELQAFLG